MELITKNADETKKFGREFASYLKGGEILCLVGDLGAGKTTFVQGLAEGLKAKGRVISPTFILMRQYTSEKFNIYHLDLYRLENNFIDELENLGVYELWQNPKNIVLIEWAEKIKNLLPKNAKWIHIKNLSEEERKITANV